MRDADAALSDDLRVAAIDDRTGFLERADVTRVIGFRCVGRPIDHEVAMLRRARPLIAGRVRVMFGGRVEQRLRRQTADVWAAAAEPSSIDDRNGGAK